MREQSMLVEAGPDGPTIDDWRWVGVPESLDFSGNPVHSGRRRATKAGLSIVGEHRAPGVTPSSVRSDRGSIYIGKHFRSLLGQFGITLQLSRGKKPSDNPHIGRLHETYQRFYQQSPSFKGRGVYERGSWVGVAADEPMCTAEKYLTDFQRFLTLDYHRQPHDGLVLPGASGVVQLGVGEDEGLEPKGPERAAVVGDDRDDRLELTGLGELHGHSGLASDPVYRARRTLHTGDDLLTDRQRERLDLLFSTDDHVEVEATWGIYQRMITAYRDPERTRAREAMRALIDCLRAASRPR